MTKVSRSVWEFKVVRDRTITVESKQANAAEKAAPILREFIGKSAKEHVVCMMLDARHNVIGLNLVSHSC